MAKFRYLIKCVLMFLFIWRRIALQILFCEAVYWAYKERARAAKAA